jgi:hypothetical protein
MNPLPANQALDAFFFDARARILDLAAFLDRIERGDNAAAIQHDPRLNKIQQAINALLETGDRRAEEVQKIFSLDYDPNWQRPKPRY